MPREWKGGLDPLPPKEPYDPTLDASRPECWERMAREMGVTVEEARKRWGINVTGR